MTSAQHYLDLLATASAADFAAEPRPGWAGVPTLFSCPTGRGDPAAGGYVVAGVPFDGTASSRPGAAEGPLAIRIASRVFSAYIDSLGEHEMLDTRTGETFRYRRPHLVDAGDLHVFPTDVARTFQAVAVEASALCEGCLTPIFLGGDHSVSFPLVAGVMLSRMRRGAPGEIGFIQIDHHFDFGRHSRLYGSVYHGSNARRISELPGMAPARMAFVGAGSVTLKAQFDALVREGYTIITAAEIRSRGAAAALERLVSTLRRTCAAIYLSIDIDVLDAGEAPGTGNVTFGGLAGADLFDIVAILKELPLAGIDLVEVAPRYDFSGRTAQMAARLLFELVYRRTPS